MNWQQWMKVERDRYKTMTPVQKYRKFALDLEGLPYRWGSENPLLGTDCSGSVCYPLLAMGYQIRTTADDLMNRLFTITPRAEYTLDKIMAVFYVTRKAKQHGDREVPAGTAVHVTPVVGLYVVLNAGDPVKLMTAKAVRMWYEKKNCDAVWREIDFQALEDRSKKYDMCFGIDDFLHSLLKEVPCKT